MSRPRLLAPLLALLALAYLGAMVVSGAMPVQRQFARFEAKGVMAAAPEQVRRIELGRAAGRPLLLRREGTGWAMAEGRPPEAVAARIETALKMMRNAGPVRVMEPDELAGLDTAPFGLDPPALRVALYDEGGATLVAASFGARNPEDFLQYMRLEGDARLYLMSRFVGAEWEAVLTAMAGP